MKSFLFCAHIILSSNENMVSRKGFEPFSLSSQNSILPLNYREIGARHGIRTHNQRFRRPTLYPVELISHNNLAEEGSIRRPNPFGFTSLSRRVRRACPVHLPYSCRLRIVRHIGNGMTPISLTGLITYHSCLSNATI